MDEGYANWRIMESGVWIFSGRIHEGSWMAYICDRCMHTCMLYLARRSGCDGGWLLTRT
jgi:hypothetical protein